MDTIQFSRGFGSSLLRVAGPRVSEGEERTPPHVPAAPPSLQQPFVREVAVAAAVARAVAGLQQQQHSHIIMKVARALVTMSFFLARPDFSFQT